MTYVEAIDIAINAVENEEVIEKLVALKAQMSKKRSSSNSKAKAETEARAEKVYNALAEMSEPVTITELINLTTDEEVASYTNQRVSALIRKLGDKVVKTVDKKVSRFSVA